MATEFGLQILLIQEATNTKATISMIENAVLEFTVGKMGQLTKDSS